MWSPAFSERDIIVSVGSTTLSVESHIIYFTGRPPTVEYGSRLPIRPSCSRAAGDSGSRGTAGLRQPARRDGGSLERRPYAGRHDPKPLATFGLPLFGAATVAAVRLLPDSQTSTPGGETLSVLFVGVVFTWSEGLILGWNLGYRFNVTLATLPMLVLAVGLVWYAVRMGTR